MGLVNSMLDDLDFEFVHLHRVGNAAPETTLSRILKVPIIFATTASRLSILDDHG